MIALRDVLHADEQADLNYFLEAAADQAGLREEELSGPNRGS